MKSRYAITNLASSLLTLVMTISASNMTIAQNGANATPPQNERSTTQANQNPQTQPSVQQQGAQSQQGADDSGLDERGATNQQSRGTGADIRPDTDCVDLDSSVAANENGQGGLSAQTTPGTNAQIAPDRDDCLDLIRNSTDNDPDAQGQNSTNTQGNGNTREATGDGAGNTRDSGE